MVRLKKILFSQPIFSQAIIFNLIFAAFVNPFISFDGWQYLSSAKSIFNLSEMSAHYFWVREPGYPILLKLSTLNVRFLWGSIIFNFLIYSTTFTLLFKEVTKTLEKAQKAKLFFFVYPTSLLLIGGYTASVAREITLISLNLLMATLLIRLVRREQILSHYQLTTGITMTVIGSGIVSRPLFLAFLFSYLCISITQIYRYPSIQRLVLYFTSSLLMIILNFTLSNYWQNLLIRSQQSSSFNLDNTLDPFWNKSLLDYLYKYIDDIVLLQAIPTSFLALIGVGVNLGWIINRQSVTISPSQNADIGFGLLSGDYPKCNNSIPHGFLADPTYLQQVEKANFCSLTGLNFPSQLFFLLYLFWVLTILLHLATFFKAAVTLHLGNTEVLAMYLPSTTLLVFYSIAGGAIDRYGSPVIPLMILGNICIYMSQMQGRKEIRHSN
jgi:hypothetical protein